MSSITSTVSSAAPGWRRASLRVGFSEGASHCLRIASTAAIVWFHIGPVPGRAWCGAGLMALVILSFMHAGQPAPLVPTLRRRGRRILVPWAFWWCIYALLALRGRAPVPVPTSAWWVIGWPAIHLWYMPFLFLNGMLIQILRPAGSALGASVKVGMVISIAVAMLLALPYIGLSQLPAGAAIWAISQPAALTGVALGVSMRRGRADWLVMIVAAAQAASAYLWYHGMRVESIGCGLGTALASCCALPIPRSRWIGRLAILTPGIYLAHPLAFRIVWYFVGSPPLWALALAGTLGSGVLAWLLKRNRWTRNLV